MYDSQRKIRKIVCITAGIWLISLLIFVLLCGKLIGKSQLVWISACTGYGIWNLCIFGCGYWAVRLEEDVMQMRPTEQPILEMVLAAIDQIAWKAEQNGQEICLERAQDICGVYDRRWTEEALFNLLDNAVKYGEKGQGSVFSIFLPKSR